MTHPAPLRALRIRKNLCAPRAQNKIDVPKCLRAESSRRALRPLQKMTRLIF